MLEKIIKKLAGFELHNNEAKVQLVLHTCVLRLPYEETKRLLNLCCESGLDILLPAAYFYEIRELMNSDLFGKKAAAFMKALKEAKVQLIEKGLEDFYLRDPWADEEDDSIEEEVFSKNTEKNIKQDLYCFFCPDIIKLDEFLKFVHKSDYHMIILPPQVSGEYKLVTINEAKRVWGGVEMKACEYGAALTREEFAEKIKQEFFAGGPYIKLYRDRLYGGGEGKLFAYRNPKGRIEKKALAKVFIHRVSKERREKLSRLCELSKFFPNVCTIKELLLEKGSSDSVQGIIIEKLEGLTLADYLNKDAAELEVWDVESVLQTLLRVVLELNLCEIYITDIDLRNFMIDKKNDLMLLDFDGVQLQNYSSGTLPKQDYVHPLHYRNIKQDSTKYYPVFQNYSVLVLFIKCMLLGNHFIPDDIAALRRQDGIWQTGKSRIADRDCEAAWEAFCAMADREETGLTADELREVRLRKKARTVFEAVFCKGKHVSIGDILEMMEA